MTNAQTPTTHTFLAPAKTVAASCARPRTAKVDVLTGWRSG